MSGENRGWRMEDGSPGVVTALYPPSSILHPLHSGRAV